MTIRVNAIAAAALALLAACSGDVPPISAAPAAGDLITMTGSTLRVPD